MKKKFNLRLSITILIILLAILIVLLVINQTNVLREDRHFTFQEAFQKQTQPSVLNTVDKNGKFVNAQESEVEQAMKITHKDNALKYMDISQKVPMSKSEVKTMLKGQGILEDQANAFIKAQDKYDVNIIYLISHARVETANGSSELAKGIKDDGKRYYNFFGVGAFDGNAVHTGKSYAKEQEWTSPYKAILGGAKFVRTQYFDNEQITLYQMRWNPQQPGEHQYASDVTWADNVARYMKVYYEQFGIKKDHIRKNYYVS
ncbi:autolysin [Staphylococcus devriesei]|uniref:N-acetylglucosaminidase n=1 Tax=Staphylococcus devriesei TaxID=586733 RepID=UPI000E6A7A8F|nr:N-acetylglucosaminidase [Staphylococcus devriesei]RIL72153.1 autolysin [Staphylococcus devriesei]